MTRIWEFGDSESPQAALPPGQLSQGQGQSALPPGQLPSGSDWDPELEAEFAPVEHYVTRPVRPATQLLARVGLWLAVGIGCLGGIVGLVRKSPEAAANDALQQDDGIGVPAPVAGVAEIVVEEWLTATEEEASTLAQYFVEPPELERVDTEPIRVLRVRTVAGERLEADGYWTVTVAADLVEIGSSNEELPPATWYVEVGIVGSVSKGLKAITTPAVVPAPPGIPDAWRTAAPNAEAPENDDRVAATVEGFLNALLAGKGDPGRYLAPRVEMEAADPAPFTELTVTQMSVVELSNGDIRIWALARVTTPGDSTHTVGYELEATQRIDRWEILSVWGAPAVESIPQEQQGDPQPLPPADGGSTDTSTTDDTSTDDTSGDTTGGSTDTTLAPESDPMEGYPSDGDGTGTTTTTQAPLTVPGE